MSLRLVNELKSIKIIDLSFIFWKPKAQRLLCHLPSYILDEVCEGGSSYMLLSDTSRLMESDSGQSSDTDIDALVHEYKEKIKVQFI